VLVAPCYRNLRSRICVWFYNVVVVVNHLESETATRGGAAADRLLRMNFVVIDELGCLPFASPAASTRSPSACSHLRLPTLMPAERVMIFDYSLAALVALGLLG
jgi:hypothetical protein